VVASVANAWRNGTLLISRSRARHWALLFTDEASFRQDSTLHATILNLADCKLLAAFRNRGQVSLYCLVMLEAQTFHFFANLFNGEGGQAKRTTQD